ncbi:TetR family transcriptional regulator [Paenibacillus sp. CAA11]|uniref:TetR/AcrR family transcriptional regulator n=1 Tax=Paenibacillus sp. CAA11 TaxID=1532905 RepID=UPI000D37F602|nr:TetR/AcrR family transcriptional regulator [Paenibacillus sp. CAA11]AWB44659.1 TetR family transcriptional regulator [Paenibacillus sp. CAA11]
MKPQSLRDIKREATAKALANAAFELAIERGMDEFVVEDVVQRAGYSRRTFANHFSCKEEAIASAVISFSSTEEAEFEMLDKPENITPLNALQQWLKLQLTANLLWKLREIISLSKRHPSLEPYILSMFHGLQKRAQETLSSYFEGRYSEEYTYLLVGALYGALLPVLDGSLTVLLPGDSAEGHPEATTFDQYLAKTFSYLRSGF